MYSRLLVRVGNGGQVSVIHLEDRHKKDQEVRVILSGKSWRLTWATKGTGITDVHGNSF